MESNSQSGQGGRRRSRKPQNRKPRKKRSSATGSKRMVNHQKPKKKLPGIPLPTKESGIIQNKANVSETAKAAKGQVKLVKYGILFFETFQEAYNAEDTIKTAANHCEQLNVVIKAEGNMDDEKLPGFDPKVKVFAGEAWHLIHTRRVDDKWYETPQEASEVS